MTDAQPSQFLSFCGPARALAAAPFIAILTIVLWLREPVFATPESQLVYGVIVTSFGILWIRSLFFCVRMREGRVKIVSWFRSYSVELQAITAAQPTQYAGMLNWGNLDGTGRWAWTLQVEHRTPAGVTRAEKFAVTLNSLSKIDEISTRLTENVPSRQA